MKANSTKNGKVYGLFLALCLWAVSPAGAQPTVVDHSFYVDAWTSVVKMTVKFSEMVDFTSAADSSKYVLQDVGAGTATLSNPVMADNSQDVTFDATGLFGGDDYILNISGVKDVSTVSTMVTTNLTGTLPAFRFTLLDGVGTATASSAPYGAPGNARDGDVTTLMHTGNANNEWWELDLGTNAGPIGGIAIWFRRDCCFERDGHLLFSILDANRATLWMGYIDQALPGSLNPRMTNMVVGAAVMGRFVRIEHPPGLASQDFLDFAEVKLLGPSTGLYIGANPVSQTVPVGKPATFTVGVQGTAPINYQWTHEGTNVPGGTSAILSIASAQPVHAGSYQVAVTDGTARQRTSSAATLSLIYDTAPPTVTGHSWALDTFKNETKLTVEFSEPVNVATATNPANFVFLGAGGAVSNGVTDGSNVTFVVSGPLADNYTLMVSGVKDLSENANVTTNLTGSVPPMPYAYLGGTITESTTPYGWVPASQGRDGSLLTIQNTGNGDNEWWEVDLGSPMNIGALTMWFRTDGLFERNHDLLFSILDANRVTVWTNYIGDYSSILKTNFVVDPPVMGRIVRVEHPVGVSEFINFAELEVLSPPTYAIGTQKLSVTPAGSSLKFQWPVSGWILQTNANLANSAGWGDIPGTTASPYITTAGPANRLFYRLRKRTQGEAATSVAFEAEIATLVAGTPENWVVTSDSAASGGKALIADGVNSSGDSPHSFAQYQITFTAPGTYYLYYRWRADAANTATDTATANSSWVGNRFGAFLDPGVQTDFVRTESNSYFAPGDNTFQWLREVTSLKYTVGAAEIASPQTLTFGTREAGMIIDRIVLSTSPGLTATDLGAIANTQ